MLFGGHAPLKRGASVGSVFGHGEAQAGPWAAGGLASDVVRVEGAVVRLLPTEKGIFSVSWVVPSPNALDKPDWVVAPFAVPAPVEQVVQKV